MGEQQQIIEPDRFFTAEGRWEAHRGIVISEHGEILDLPMKRELPKGQSRKIPGAVIPGFINAHCHLELSHMKGLIPTGTGLIPFVKDVVTKRGFPDEVIQEAIQKAGEEMENNGIVAVGDISNQADTFLAKSKSPLRYYTFVETFDFFQESAARDEFQKSMQIHDALNCKAGDQKSLVPHAPYSVSAALFDLIRGEHSPGRVLSIHNQEIEDENQMFLNGTGGLIPFFESFGFPMEHFQPLESTSIHYHLPRLPSDAHILLVHNTMSTPQDIAWAERQREHLYWVSCPNANLYIENQLPNYQSFIDNDCKIAIGTDSLASNWQLSVLEEIKTIKKYQSTVPTTRLLTWATLNGARALQFEEELGSIEVGKSPGLFQLNLREEEKWELTPGTQLSAVAPLSKV